MQSAIPDLLRSAKPGWSAGCRPKLSIKHFITDLKNNSPHNKGQIIAWKPLLMPHRYSEPLRRRGSFLIKRDRSHYNDMLPMLEIVAIALAARCMWCAVVHMASSQIIWWMRYAYLTFTWFSFGKRSGISFVCLVSRLVFLKGSHHVHMRIDMYAGWSHYRD